MAGYRLLATEREHRAHKPARGHVACLLASSCLRLSVAFCSRAHRGDEPGLASPFGERPGGELGAVIGMDHGAAALGFALFYGHPERVGGERGGRVVADRPADHASAVGVENDRAVHLALAGRVLGNVGQPQLIRAFPTESAVDQIVRARLARHPSSFRRSRATRDARAAHQHRDRVVTNPDPAPEDQLGVHPSGAVAAVGGRVHLADHIGQPRMANRARRWRPASPRVIARARYTKHATGNLDG